ncbi:DUF6911 family protein [Roseateles chitinivorans]|uniref:DUF6911 family protein n=1 Tax=Roseateles chitinivorans TaxID=2917965 RepID=UPI003F625048
MGSERASVQLELSWRAHGSNSPFTTRNERVQWSDVDLALSTVFDVGGMVRLSAVQPEETWLIQLALDCEPGACRIIARVNSEDQKMSLLEWCQGERSDVPIVISDHAWDARTVCKSLAVVKAVFQAAFDNPAIEWNDLKGFESPWFRSP